MIDRAISILGDIVSVLKNDKYSPERFLKQYVKIQTVEEKRTAVVVALEIHLMKFGPTVERYKYAVMRRIIEI